VDLPVAFPAVAASLTEIRSAVRACARAAGATPDVIAAAVLAVNEAATNSIVHGYAGGRSDETVQVTGEHDDGWLRFVVADTGTGLRLRRHSPGLGLGFAIIAQCADALELHEIPGDRLELRLSFRLNGAA